MSKLDELLRRKRQAQIAEMEGDADKAEGEAVDSELRQYSRNASRNISKLAAAQRVEQGRDRLYLGAHIRKRMAQRNMSIKNVYAIWRYGERRELEQEDRVAFVLTEKALRAMPAGPYKKLRRHKGAALLVQYHPEEEPKDPAAVTILADGEDTRFR